MGDHPIKHLDSGCGVIMDALSLREGFQLLRDLPEAHGWDVDVTESERGGARFEIIEGEGAQ
jgi:hypothetical protein